MDSESIFIECVNLAFEICLFSVFYKLYESTETCLKSLKEAQIFEINSELLEKVKSIGGVVPYAVVSGNVKALSSSLRSHYIFSVRGVIRESVMLRMWNAIQGSVSTVPFAVCGRTSGFFKKQISVEIVDPLMAEELTLSKTYDFFINPVMFDELTFPKVYNFIMNLSNSFVEAMHDLDDFLVILDELTVPKIYDFIMNLPSSFVEAMLRLDDFLDNILDNIFEKGTVVLEERMLVENSTLTAVGKLIIDKDKVKIIPPNPGLKYFVTPLTLDSLTKKVSDSARFRKSMCIIGCVVSLYLFASTAVRGFIKIKQQINRAKHLKEMEEARCLRLMADSTRKLQARYNNCSRCVVCSEYPVELLINECGHACLCLNCSRKIQNLCPVCRSKIVSFVPVILP